MGIAPVGDGDALFRGPGAGMTMTGKNRDGDPDPSRMDELHRRLRVSERLASIGTLAAGLCHDMNNLLMPLRGHLDSLEAGGLSESQKTDLISIRGAVDFLQQLTNGLRLFALDPDDPDASPGRTEIGAWWSQVRPLLSRAVPEHLTLEVDIPERLPAVGVPAHRLTQAVLNLLINSSEAVGQDGTVRIWAGTTDDARFVKLGVTDDGRGMSATAREHALEPFFTTKRRDRSTGLGLSLVHGIVHSAGGSVDIDSAPGETTITMNLPSLAEDEGGERGAAPPDAASAVVTVSDPRIAACFTSLLRSAGFSVEPESGAGAAPPAVWVGEASASALPRAVRLRETSPGCRLIAYGRSTPAWEGLGATVIDERSGLVGIRDAIRQLALAAEEHR